MKKAVITGGNKGMGLETTKLFLKAGYKVIVVARDFENFAPAKHENVETVFCDIADISSIKGVVDCVGYADVLVNNAGVMYSLPYDSYPAENQQRLMNVNLYAPIEFIKEMSAHMKERKSGRIINVSSVAGFIGHPDIWYGVSKAGIINATKSFAKILAPFGITVNTVAPGPTQTDMMQVIPEVRKAAMKAATYTNSFAQPEDVAKTVFWLGTEAPEYINGVCIDLNNGAFAR